MVWWRAASAAVTLILVAEDASYPLGLDRSQFASAINKLPEAERLVITLAYYEGLNDVDIAAALQENEGRIAEIRESGLRRVAADLGIPSA